MKKTALALVFIAISLITAGAAVKSFSTGGHTVYHLRPGTIDGQRVVISAAYDGTVLCHTHDGNLLWKANAGGHFPIDMAVVDIDADGDDETLVATGGGVLYAVDNDGTSLWTFERTAPLFQVAATKLPGGEMVILTGGVDKVLYKLSPWGRLLQSLQMEKMIRHLRVGNILGDGHDHIAMATTNRGLNGRISLMLMDPVDLQIKWTQNEVGTGRVFSMAILDLTGDGKEDILLGSGRGARGRIIAFDQTGTMMFNSADDRIPNIPYQMNLLDPINLPEDAYVMGHYANTLIRYNLDGSFRDMVYGPYSFADGAYDPVTFTYFMGSAVSGGDGIYAIQLDDPDWQQSFEQIKPVGKMVQIERNFAQLERQVEKFKAPDYQPETRKASVVYLDHGPLDLPKRPEMQNVRFVAHIKPTQKFEHRDELWNRSLDHRFPYDKSADEIVAMASELEAEGQDFVMWTIHGHAVYIAPYTFERVIEAAPNHLKGFVFAEMERVDDHMQEVVEEIVHPLAEICRDKGLTITLRSKNIFWNGTVYVPYWRRVLLNDKFSDVFKPAVEDTNCRTGEISLSGRVGLWTSGCFDSWVCRTETDNANFDRMQEWGGHQVINHHLRHMMSRAMHGAETFIVTIHNGPFADKLRRQMLPFYNMLEKGIVRIPERDELLSLSPVALGMRSPPSETFLRHGINGHEYRYPEDTHEHMVFDRLDCYWATADLASHDFSRYALGLERRMCNFLPPAPYGLIPMIPDDVDLTGTRFEKKISTDGRYFYDDVGRRYEAAEYQPVVEETLREAQAQLPVRVTGDVHWSVVRLDPTHVRVTLVDSGYLDPADRDATIILQHLDGVKSMDILSGEEMKLEEQTIDVTVPMGIFRIIDIEHR